MQPTGTDLLTENSYVCPRRVFVIAEHVKIEATWVIYQRVVAAYPDPNKRAGGADMTSIIDALTSGCRGL